MARIAKLLHKQAMSAIRMKQRYPAETSPSADGVSRDIRSRVDRGSGPLDAIRARRNVGWVTMDEAETFATWDLLRDFGFQPDREVKYSDFEPGLSFDLGTSSYPPGVSRTSGLRRWCRSVEF